MVAIGNFDGIHLGHQELIARAVSEAQARSAPCVVLTFEPTIKAHFAKEHAVPFLPLGWLGAKVRSLSALGADSLALLAPRPSVLALSPQAFIDSILVKGLKASLVITGADFRFGKDRQGDGELLKKQSSFDYTAIADVMINQQRVSSTQIRHLIASGDLAAATAALGAPFALRGRVVAGMGVGRSLGFPTANLSFPTSSSTFLPLPEGVFVAKTKRTYQGTTTRHLTALSIGTRATVSSSHERVVEAHLLDFSGDLYGAWLEIEMYEKLRDQARYHTREQLIGAIAHDCAQTRLRAKTYPAKTYR